MSSIIGQWWINFTKTYFCSRVYLRRNFLNISEIVSILGKWGYALLRRMASISVLYLENHQNQVTWIASVFCHAERLAQNFDLGDFKWSEPEYDKVAYHPIVWRKSFVIESKSFVYCNWSISSIILVIYFTAFNYLLPYTYISMLPS